jgi:antitoxin component YwqK of YwqJK toxin-antitoxin module
VVRFHTRAIGLTLAAACGSGAAPSSSPPAKATATRGSDAGVVAAPTSSLVCTAGTSPSPAPALEPSWYCARSDGTRHGPFVTLYPDGAIAVRGNHADGKLDGTWQRLHPSGAIAERGAYAGGHKTGRWQQWSANGALIGEYEMIAGTGIEKRWFDDGTPYSEVGLEGSVQHGATKIFSRDGSLAISARYTAGKLDGPHVFGSPSTMRMEETLAAGVRHGVRKIWLLGNLLAEEKFDRGGKLHGPYVLWRRYKLVRAKGQFSHDKRVGAWLWNDRAGNKEKAGSYVAGKKDGTWTEYFEGKLVFSGQYTAGKPDGEFVYWDKLGNELGRFTITAGTGVMETFHLNKKTSSKQRLVDGLESGSYQELTARGIVVVDGRYANGKKHGTWKEYSPGGVLVLEQKWNRGKLDGFVKKYVDGKLASEATYVDGMASGRYAEYRAGKPAVTGHFAAARKIGTWQHHDPAGTVILTATYKDGVLDGPWRQVVDGSVLEGQMASGRRSGTWTRTDRAGAVSKLTHGPP